MCEYASKNGDFETVRDTENVNRMRAFRSVIELHSEDQEARQHSPKYQQFEQSIKRFWMKQVHWPLSPCIGMLLWPNSDKRWRFSRSMMTVVQGLGHTVLMASMVLKGR